MKIPPACNETDCVAPGQMRVRSGFLRPRRFWLIESELNEDDNVLSHSSPRSNKPWHICGHVLSIQGVEQNLGTCVNYFLEHEVKLG